MRFLSEVDLSEYDFLDFGAHTGGSIEFCEAHFGGRGLGIELNPEVVARASHDVVCGDALGFDGKKVVRYASMCDFLEHLPTSEDVKKALRVAVRAAREFVWIMHPSFEDEAYLRAVGLKAFWHDWGEHPSHILLSDFAAWLRLPMELEYVKPIHDSSDPAILPLSAPSDQPKYDPSHGPKPHVVFPRPLYRQIRIKVALPQ